MIRVPSDRLQQRLTDLLRQANLPLNTRCGQRGICDGCVLELIAGTVAHIQTGQTVTANGKSVLIRGCIHRLHGQDTVHVRIPPRSMLAYQPQVVTDFRINIPRAHHPLLQILEINRTDLAAGVSLGEEVCRIAAKQFGNSRPVRIAPLAKAQAAAIETSPVVFASVALQQDHWLIIGVSATAPDKAPVGAAVDIGTTTVATLLVDLASGNVLGRAAAFNQQIHLGDDVVTRIALCCNDPAMTRQLQDAVALRTILPLLTEAAQQADISIEQIACLSIAGNTTMQHLVAEVNPRSMGTAPFTPVFLEHRVLNADVVFHQQAPHACASFAPLHLLPSAAAYIGADVCAGIVASGLLYDEGPSLLVDVGTNGEVILKHGERLIGCATAAGPAFEGAGLSCGIRAGQGAIGHINLAGNPFAVSARWIGQEKLQPVGLCGSAYIDFLAEARRIGLINAAGRYDRDRIPEAKPYFMPWCETDTAFRVAASQGQQPIVISQRDIASLLQAKAAIAAGILTLLGRCGLGPADIKRIYLAGGFGTHLAAKQAIACGLLPGFVPSQIQTVGNTSLAGAYLALLDSTVLDELSRIGRRLEVVELNLDPSFEACYIDQLILPEPITT